MWTTHVEERRRHQVAVKAGADAGRSRGPFQGKGAQQVVGGSTCLRAVANRARLGPTPGEGGIIALPVGPQPVGFLDLAHHAGAGATDDETWHLDKPGVPGVPPIPEQYKDGRYADFVESPANVDIYEHWLHHSFLKHALPALAERRAKQNEGHGDGWQKPRPPRLLDFGCGNAVLARICLERVPNAGAGCLDRSGAMLDRARRAGGALLGRMNLREMDIRAYRAMVGSENPVQMSFDLVASGFVLAHLHQRRDLVWVMGEVRALLKPGAKTVHLLTPLSEGDAFITPKDGGRNPREHPLFTPSVYRAVLPMNSGPPVEVWDAEWSHGDIVSACEDAGLEKVRVELCEVSQEGINAHGKEYWQRRCGQLGKYAVL
eukprot:gene3568-4012_t